MKKHEKPSAARTGQLRAYLAKVGCPPATANQLITMTKTMAQIEQDLTAYLCTQSKAASGR